MNTKQIVITIVISTTTLFASFTQSHAFFDKVFKDDNKPAHQSSKKSDSPIHIGMTIEEVRAKLGDPDSENEGSDGSTEWLYHPGSVADCLQDGAVNTATEDTVGSVPFIGSMLSDASNRAEKPIKAKRTGYFIIFKNNKVVSFEKRKTQG